MLQLCSVCAEALHGGHGVADLKEKLKAKHKTATARKAASQFGFTLRMDEKGDAGLQEGVTKEEKMETLRAELEAKVKKRERSILEGRAKAKVMKQKHDRMVQQKEDAHHAFKNDHYQGMLHKIVHRKSIQLEQEARQQREARFEEYKLKHSQQMKFVGEEAPSGLWGSVKDILPKMQGSEGPSPAALKKNRRR
jgi:hypothetical protein